MTATSDQAEEMLEELIDRFGEPPKSVQNLLTIARLKAVAHSVYIKEIVQREDLLKILMYEKAKIHAQRIPELVKTFAPSLKFAADPKGPYFTYRLGANSREKNREILDVCDLWLNDGRTVRGDRTFAGNALCTEEGTRQCP